MDLQYEIIVIGSGPGGMTAAIYASRAGLKTAILEAGAPGGKLVKTHTVENYPAFDTISGVDLAMKMHTHSLSFEADYLYGDVVKVEKMENQKGFIVKTASGETFTGGVVIAATGTIEKKLGLPMEDELTTKGLSYCAVCDGAFYKKENVIVIGGGQSALEEAVYLTQFADKVTIVIRRDVFRGDLAAQNAALRNPKIEVIREHLADHFLLDEQGKIAGLAIRNVKTGDITELPGKAVFPYIGANPASKYIEHLGVTDKDGYVLVNEQMETGVDGLYAVGDMIDKKLRQIVTATSDGAIAAQNAFKYLHG